MRRALAVLVILALPAFAADDNPLFAIYVKYGEAIDKNDLAAAKKLISAGKQRTLAGMPDEEALAKLNVLSPKADLRVYKEIVEGDDATLIVRAKIDDIDSTGRIEFAREDGQWKILSELWDLGGDPEVPAVEPGPQPKNDEQRAALRALRERGFPAPSPEFLVMSAGTGDLEAVKLFLQAGYPVDSTDGGTPAIVNAAMGGYGDVVLHLIEAGADVNAQDEIHTTALMRIANKCDATEVVRALIGKGARVDLQSDGGSTALQLAEWSECTANAELIRAASPE